MRKERLREALLWTQEDNWREYNCSRCCDFGRITKFEGSCSDILSFVDKMGQTYR